MLPSLWAVETTAFAQVQDAIKLSLQRLGVDAIDLMLLHAPGAPEGRAEAWRALEQAHKEVNEGKALKGVHQTIWSRYI